MCDWKDCQIDTSSKYQEFFHHYQGGLTICKNHVNKNIILVQQDNGGK